MKELILVRHAKSDWGNEGLQDIDRSLNERGYSDAYVMSEWFRSKQGLPDLILSSTATRALSTALIFARHLKLDTNHLVLEPGVYEASQKKLLELIQNLDDKIKKLMLFGHNPGITNLCNHLASEYYIDNLPTCGMVSLKFDVKNWKKVNEKCGTLHFAEFPKDYRTIK